MCIPAHGGGEEGVGSWVTGGTSMNVITDTYHALRSMRKRQVGGLPPDQPVFAAASREPACAHAHARGRGSVQPWREQRAVCRRLRCPGGTAGSQPR